jgi:hypothetical protein
MRDCWPLGVALRGEASSHHMLRWLKTVVVSDVEKAHEMRQVGDRKTIAVRGVVTSRWHRNRGVQHGPGMSLAGARFLGQVVPGAQAT